jgi:oligopeptide/dipeptide ABC transporter ATP-binding protein
MSPADAVLEVDGLSVVAGRGRSARTLVDDVGFRIGRGEAVGIVGESGSGKTLSALGATGLLPAGVHATRGRAVFLGTDLLSCSARERRRFRGRHIGMVFQDPTTCLHPAIRVGDQLVEAIRVHARELTAAAARQRAIELLSRVGIARPAQRMDDHPFQWSGGMRQRAMIAMAVAHDPALIVADEPTTALDVTVQAQILDLLGTARADTGAALVLISHDLGVIAEVAERVVVMYAGRVVEDAPVTELFARPAHPYTAGLLASVPTLRDLPGQLSAIAGSPPEGPQSGCPFEPRCPVGRGDPRCTLEAPVLRASAHGRVACHHAAVAEPTAASLP